MLHRLASARFAFAICVGVSLLMGAPAGAASVVDEWTSVKAPPPPEVKPVTTDPKTTALLVLDLVRRLQRAAPAALPAHGGAHPGAAGKGPRCRRAGGLQPRGQQHRGRRAQGRGSARLRADGDIGTDKFLGTDLDKILREKGIKTVIVVGTAAHGAVLTTATAAALRGFSVVVPVDGLSSETPYAEQYTVWNLVNAPVIAPRVTLARDRERHHYVLKPTTSGHGRKLCSVLGAQDRCC